MCTATWFPARAGFELWFNRDERRTRGPALPPAERRQDGSRFIAPLDPDFGGTWIVANEHGLALCLLNGYAPEGALAPAGGDWTSRGLLVLSLADSRSVAEVGKRLDGNDLARYRSFELASFAADGSRLLVGWRNGRLSEKQPLDPDLPLISSSYDTSAVRRSRAELFGEMGRQPGNDPEALRRRYHSSHLPARGAYSPCMHREDASTVSFSRVRVDRACVSFFYAPHSPCRGMPRQPAVSIPRGESRSR